MLTLGCYIPTELLALAGDWVVFLSAIKAVMKLIPLSKVKVDIKL